MTDARIDPRNSICTHSGTHLGKKRVKKVLILGQIWGGTTIFSHAHKREFEFEKFFRNKVFGYILAHTVKENAFGGRPSD
mgnify:FL=1